MSCRYLSRTKNKYAKPKFSAQIELAGYRIHKKPICPEHFTDNIKLRLSNKMICSKENHWGSRGFVEIYGTLPGKLHGILVISLKRIFFSTEMISKKKTDYNLTYCPLFRKCPLVSPVFNVSPVPPSVRCVPCSSKVFTVSICAPLWPCSSVLPCVNLC